MSENETPKEEPVMRYVGDGTLRIPGVPLRDLTKDDVAALSPIALREAMTSSLYEIARGAHLPVNRSAVEDPPEVPPVLEEPPPSDDAGGASDETGAAGRSRRRNAGDGA